MDNLLMLLNIADYFHWTAFASNTITKVVTECKHYFGYK